jgi:lysophospholipase L1-like esterase
VEYTRLIPYGLKKRMALCTQPMAKTGMNKEQAKGKQPKGLRWLLKTELFLFFSALDILLVGALVLMMLSWLLNPLYISLPELADKTAAEQPDPLALLFTWPIMALGGGLLVLRIGFRFLANKLFFNTPGILDFLSLRYLAYILAGGFACTLLLEFILVKVDFRKELPRYHGPVDPKLQLDFGGYIRPDPYLIWTFTPNEPYPRNRRINAAGFIGKQAAADKPEMTKRIFCLGGSTTSLASPAYPDLLQQQLNAEAILGNTWEVYNCAVDRYTVSQGLAQLERQILANPTNQPDIVTVCYGWDDHWRGVVPDSLRMEAPESSERASRLNRMQERRVVQLITFNRQLDRISARDDNPDGLRVSPKEYQWALVRIVRAVKAAGARPVLVTSARGDLDEALVAKGLAKSVEQAHNLHDAYNRITREVCEEEGAGLIDLAMWSEEDASSRFVADGLTPGALVEADGIHLSGQGHQLLAELLVDYIRK